MGVANTFDMYVIDGLLLVVIYSDYPSPHSACADDVINKQFRLNPICCPHLKLNTVYS